MKPVLLFDIDFTLLNSAALRETFDTLFAKALRAAPETITKTKEAYMTTLEKSTDFKPDVYINIICNEFRADKKVCPKYISVCRIFIAGRFIPTHCLNLRNFKPATGWTSLPKVFENSS